MTLKNYLKGWLAEQKGHIKLKTYQRYMEIVNNNISPICGELELADITAKHVRSFVAQLSVAYADNTVLQIIGLLKRALNFAVQEEYIKVNPTTGIVLHHKQQKIEPFNENEQREIIEYILQKKNAYYYGILIALYTGIRIGELLALTWDDVDMKSRTISIRKTASVLKVSSGDNPFISTPKTVAGIRTIPYPKQLHILLKKMKSLGSNYVVCNHKGNFMTVYGYQKIFARLLDRIGIKHKGFHSLRHTYATCALETGADIKTLSEMLGHSSPTVTITRYCHSTDKQKNRLCEKIGEQMKKVCLLC